MNALILDGTRDMDALTSAAVFGMASAPAARGAHVDLAVLRMLDPAAESLEDGGAIPGDAAPLYAKPLVPRRPYTLIGNLGWRIRTRKHEAQRPIGFRSYAQD